MKKLFVAISILIIFLSVATVTAGLFGPDTIECQQFSIEVPSGFQITDGWEDNHINDVYVGTGVPMNGETHRIFKMTEISSSNDASNQDKVVVEKYDDGNLLAEKCQSEDGKDNYTYAEFDKEGHHFVINISWENNLEKLNLNEDVKLIKDVMGSTHIK